MPFILNARTIVGHSLAQRHLMMKFCFGLAQVGNEWSTLHPYIILNVATPPRKIIKGDIHRRSVQTPCHGTACPSIRLSLTITNVQDRFALCAEKQGSQAQLCRMFSGVDLRYDFTLGFTAYRSQNSQSSLLHPFVGLTWEVINAGNLFPCLVRHAFPAFGK
jgi:hypothetical protein